MQKEISRRSFLKTGSIAALGLSVAPSTILGKTSTSLLSVSAAGVIPT